MAWDFSTEPEFEKKLEWVRAFVETEVRPLEFIYYDLTQEQLDRIEAPLKEEVKRQGLWAAHLDRELGGQGMGQLNLALLHEILGRYVMAPEIFGNQAPDSGNAELLAVGANEAQKQRWLWPLLDGRLRSSFALTEPFVASTDPTAIRSMAVRDGDHWVLNGHKWFASNADVADFVLAMVVTNPEVSAVRDADRIIGLVEAEEKGPAKLVINRIKPEMVRRGDMLAVDDVLELLAVELIGMVPDDEIVLTSTNRGLPVVLDGKSRAGQAFRNIARRLKGEQVPFMSMEGEGGLLGRLARWVRPGGN